MQVKGRRPLDLILKCLRVYHYKSVFLAFLMSNVINFKANIFTLRYLLLSPFHNFTYRK